MAERIDISNEASRKELNYVLRKSFQSASINFLIGSGCSVPAINPLGSIEKDIEKLLEEDRELEAEQLMYKFLVPIAESNEKLTRGSSDTETKETLSKYTAFLESVYQMLTKSKNNILPKKANIFSTNYDLFIEKASEKFGVLFNLNDGFKRTPRLDSQFSFSVTEFFSTVSNIGHLYNYKVEIPSINVIKLHGSLGWGKRGNEIIFEIQDYLKHLKDNAHAISQATKNEDDGLLSLLKDFNKQFKADSTPKCN